MQTYEILTWIEVTSSSDSICGRILPRCGGAAAAIGSIFRIDGNAAATYWCNVPTP